MGKLSMELYLKNLSKRCRAFGKLEKGILLQELCDSSGYHKKHADTLTEHSSEEEKTTNKNRSAECVSRKYNIEPLKRIWLLSDQLCGKRLKMALPLWQSKLPMRYDRTG